MSGLERPEEVVDWSEVEISNLIAERDNLRAQIEADSDVMFMQRQERDALLAERDRARATAVRLEQELARVTDIVSDVVVVHGRGYTITDSMFVDFEFWPQLLEALGLMRGDS